MLLEIMIGAFLGGALLNLLPCALPVIPIKLLSFLKNSQDSRGRRLALAAIYALGILLSFIVLGAICAGALMFGSYLGFGFQLNNWWFSGLMALLMAVMGGHLLGINEWVKNRVYLPCIERLKTGSGKDPLISKEVKKSLIYPISARLTSFLSPILERIRAKSIWLKAFGEGCLTTALGSACTGPFLAASMGLAVMMSPWHVLAAFTLAGLGMGLPYVILSLLPLQRFLPRPGKWIKWVERISGGFMLLVGAWFLYIAL